jgi:hypothetical protein
MSEVFECWAVLELMGHRKLAGRVTEATLGGASFLRLDVPGLTPESPAVTQFYSPAAVYCLTPVSEEVARQVARTFRPRPVESWELPLLGQHMDDDDENECEGGEPSY